MQVLGIIMFVAVVLILGYSGSKGLNTESEKIGAWIFVGILLVIGMLAIAGIVKPH